MTYVQSAYGAGSPTPVIAVLLTPANVAVGDLLVVMYRGVSSDPTSVSDNLGNTYTKLTNEGGQTRFDMYRCIVTVAGACTVTVWQADGRIGVSVHHYSGMNGTPLDQETDINADAGVASATDAFTTTTATQAIVAMWGGADPPTPEADYGGANLQGNTTGRLYSCHRLTTTTLTGEVVNWTHGNVSFQCKAASFKAALVVTVGGAGAASCGVLDGLTTGVPATLGDGGGWH